MSNDSALRLKKPFGACTLSIRTLQYPIVLHLSKIQMEIPASLLSKVAWFVSYFLGARIKMLFVSLPEIFLRNKITFAKRRKVHSTFKHNTAVNITQ